MMFSGGPMVYVEPESLAKLAVTMRRFSKINEE